MVIDVTDTSDATLRGNYEECFKFIEEGMKCGGTVIHWYISIFSK